MKRHYITDSANGKQYLTPDQLQQLEQYIQQQLGGQRYNS